TPTLSPSPEGGGKEAAGPSESTEPKKARVKRTKAQAVLPSPLWGGIEGGGARHAHRASTHMVERARELRNGATELERKLWYRLRALRERGLHFRRQVPFGRLVLDFACHDRRFVVEIDGDQHFTP